MKIGVNLFCYAGLDVDTQIEYMKKYGFTNTFTDSEVNGLDKIMEKLSAAGKRLAGRIEFYKNV